MPIDLACPACGMKGKAPDTLAGKAARCRCGATIAVPASASAPTVPLAAAPQGGKIKFICSCGQRLDLPVSQAGRTGTCPKCKAKITVPAAEVPVAAVAEPETQPMPTIVPSRLVERPPDPAPGKPVAPLAAGRVPCPKCGGLIRNEARKCNHCGHLVRPPSRRTSAAASDAVEQEFREFNEGIEQRAEDQAQASRHRDLTISLAMVGAFCAFGFVTGGFTGGAFLGAFLAAMGIAYKVAAFALVDGKPPFYRGMILGFVLGLVAYVVSACRRGPSGVEFVVAFVVGIPVAMVLYRISFARAIAVVLAGIVFLFVLFWVLGSLMLFVPLR